MHRLLVAVVLVFFLLLFAAMLGLAALMPAAAGEGICPDRLPHCIGPIRDRSVAPARGKTPRRPAAVSRSCLVPAARALLARIEARFGPVTLISACRPGAVIAGTRKPSLHRDGRAADFVAPRGRKAAVLRWLAAHHSGGTMSYRDARHIHVDIRPRRFVRLGALAWPRRLVARE